MRQFIIPQFLDVEPRVFAFVTVRQFLIMMVAAGLCVLAWKTADLSLALTEMAFVLIIFGAFAFVKINNRYFHYFILDVVHYFKRPNLRVWDKESSINYKKPGKDKKISEKEIYIPPKLSSQKLSELSLVVDTGGVYREY